MLLSAFLVPVMFFFFAKQVPLRRRSKEGRRCWPEHAHDPRQAGRWRAAASLSEAHERSRVGSARVARRMFLS
jgi:hypothetical protein